MKDNKRKYQINLDKYKVSTEKKLEHSFVESKYFKSNQRREVIHIEPFNTIPDRSIKEDTKNIKYYPTISTINASKTNYTIKKVEKEELNWRNSRFINFRDNKEKKGSKIDNISNRSNNIYIDRSIKEEKKEIIPNVYSNTIVFRDRRSNIPEMKLFKKNNDETQNTNSTKNTKNDNISNFDKNKYIFKKENITTKKADANISKKSQKKEEEDKFKNIIETKKEAKNNFYLGKLIPDKSESIINDKKDKIYNKDPKILKFRKDLIKDSFSSYPADNTSLIVKTIDDLLLIIYAKEDSTIICYNIINNQKVNEVRKAHDKYITNLRYYPDTFNRINLMLSLSTDDNHLKVWNIGNFQCLLDLKKVNESGWINSACFLNDNNKIYVLSSNARGFSQKAGLIKVFDLKGKFIKQINESNVNTYFIDYYYDNKSSKNYIITGNACFSKSYDYDKNKIYHVYKDNKDKDNSFHISVIINDKGDKTNLIESCQYGKIRIWDFHSGVLLDTIIVYDLSLYGICLWNNNYLMVGCEDKSIKIIDLDNKRVIAELIGHKNIVTMVRKLVYPKYREFLVSQGHLNDGFKLWV